MKSTAPEHEQTVLSTRTQGERFFLPPHTNATMVVVRFTVLCLLTEGLAAGGEMPGDRVLDHLEQHRAVAGGADLELMEQLNCLFPFLF